MDADQIRNYPLFSGLTEAELAQLLPCISKRSFGKCVYLYHPGNPGYNCYLVESGLVRLFFTNASGKEFTLELVGPPAVLGTPLLPEGSHRLLGAAAVQPTVVLAISNQHLASFAQRFPRLMNNFYQSIDHMLRKTLLFTRALVTLSVEGRLAGLILYLSRNSPGVDRLKEFEIPISQAEMANWLGASRGHLNRALNHLQQLGLIRMEGQKITILDRTGLKRLTENLADE